VYRLFLAFRYLRSRLVNLISVAGVMFGVAVLIVVVSVMDGFQDRVRRVVRGSLSHLVLTPLSQAEALPPFKNLERDLQTAAPRVEAATPQVSMPVFYEFETNQRSALSYQGRAWHQMQAVGIDWKREIRVSELADYVMAVVDPEDPFFHPFAAEREKTTVLVSRTFAENFRLGKCPEHPNGLLMDDRTDKPLADGALLQERLAQVIGTEVGIMWGRPEVDEKTGETTVKPNNANLVVSGVYDAHDTTEDNVRMYLDIAALRKLGKIEDEYLQVNVRLDDYEAAEGVKAALSGRYANLFGVRTWEDQKATFLAAVDQEKVLLVIVLSFIVLLGGFIILATLTLTVVEKTKDIGVVAALGAGRRGILSIFLLNGLLIGVIGAVLGLGLGYWFTANVDGVRAFIAETFGRDLFPPSIYHFRSVPVIWSWPSVFTIMGGSVMIAFLAGLLPALRAARLDPIAALRYE
jgi:lipoprotein-releasing system permease protein